MTSARLAPPPAPGDDPAMPPADDFRALAPDLDQGLDALGQALPPATRLALLDYLALLARWNRAWNLSAVREPRQMLVRHVLDSLAVLPFLHGDRLADVGSGPGLPGIPLALARPDLTVLLVDSNTKMARFQREALRQLGLAPRCQSLQARVEQLHPDVGYDTIVSRAFSSLAQFVTLSAGLRAPGGRWLALKGRRPDPELAQLPAPVQVLGVHALQVPGLAGDRHAIIMTAPPPTPPPTPGP
jgi:16S rRNA (guanine527-N7)-methyltransferase